MTGGQADCPIVFRGPNASAGQLGATHSVAYDSMYAQFPGLKLSMFQSLTMQKDS